MAKKEHWTRRIKRENAELKVENTELKTANAELKKAVVNTDKGDPDAVRPDGLIISLTDSGVNDIREANNAQIYEKSAHLAILGDDELEIRVESRDDFYKYSQFASSRDIVGMVSPLPSWNQATEQTQAWLDEHDNLAGMRITVFDPYGFMDQFDGLNVVQTYTEHEWWRTDEGLQKLDDLEIERQLAQYAEKQALNTSWWRVTVSMHWTRIDGESVKDQWLSAKNDLERANLLKRVRDAIQPTYPDGSTRKYKLEGFQLNGEYGEVPKDIQFGVPCDKGQRVIVQFDGQFPGNIRTEFITQNDDDTHSPTRDTGGASIEFQ